MHDWIEFAQKNASSSFGIPMCWLVYNYNVLDHWRLRSSHSWFACEKQPNPKNNETTMTKTFIYYTYIATMYYDLNVSLYLYINPGIMLNNSYSVWICCFDCAFDFWLAVSDLYERRIYHIPFNRLQLMWQPFSWHESQRAVSKRVDLLNSLHLYSVHTHTGVYNCEKRISRIGLQIRASIRWQLTILTLVKSIAITKCLCWGNITTCSQYTITNRVLLLL